MDIGYKLRDGNDYLLGSQLIAGGRVMGFRYKTFVTKLSLQNFPSVETAVLAGRFQAGRRKFCNGAVNG